MTPTRGRFPLLYSHHKPAVDQKIIQKFSHSLHLLKVFDDQVNASKQADATINAPNYSIALRYSNRICKQACVNIFMISRCNTCSLPPVNNMPHMPFSEKIPDDLNGWRVIAIDKFRPHATCYSVYALTAQFEYGWCIVDYEEREKLDSNPDALADLLCATSGVIRRCKIYYNLSQKPEQHHA